MQFATVKYDGHSITLEKDSLGVVTTRTPKKIITKQLLVCCKTWIERFTRHAPNGTLLKCEIFVPNGDATDVPHHLKEGLPLSLRVLAVIRYGGCDVSGADIPMAQRYSEATGLPYIEWYRFTPGRTEQEYNNLAITKGIEGWVFKNINYDPDNEYKLKPILTADLVVSGFKDGRGKYAGLIGALLLADSTGRVVASVSGMDDATRINIDEDTDLGRICEVAYQKVTRQGKLRHPRFKRWRDDKTDADYIHGPSVLPK